MVSNVSGSAVRVGYAVLVNNRGIGKPDPVESVISHNGVYGSQRDPNSGLADSAIDLSLYILDHKKGFALKREVPAGRHFSTYA